MKVRAKVMCTAVLCCMPMIVAADDDNAAKLLESLRNLGGYLGYNLKTPATPKPEDASQALIRSEETQKNAANVVTSFFGALPVAFMNGTVLPILPFDLFVGWQALIDRLFNLTYQGYNTPPNPGTPQQISVNELIDQKTYQDDPVSQAIFNILGTPSTSYCLSENLDGWVQGCDYKTNSIVMSKVVGQIPDQDRFITYETNQPLIGQLNVNSLLGSLQYVDKSTSSTSSPSVNNNDNPGLVAQNQTQQAANFVRYATGEVTPIALPERKTYKALYKAISASTEIERKRAEATLSTYLANLRVYAAQSSVGIGNVYYLLAKRIPQQQPDSSNTGATGNKISQAMSEFKMASWRLFNPDPGNEGATDTRWLKKLETASSATVEKEIATLLAEINYQMYLDRQLQERMLLTNSILLLQSTRSSRPLPNFEGQEELPPGVKGNP